MLSNTVVIIKILESVVPVIDIVAIGHTDRVLKLDREKLLKATCFIQLILPVQYIFKNYQSLSTAILV